MSPAVKIALVALAAFLALSLGSVVSVVLLPSSASWQLGLVSLAARLLLAAVVGRIAWTRLSNPTPKPSLWYSVALGAVVVGGLSFLLGFVGPMLVAPESNQGPLLGILVTGPLGTIFGAIAGAARYRKQVARASSSVPTRP